MTAGYPTGSSATGEGRLAMIEALLRPSTSLPGRTGEEDAALEWLTREWPLLGAVESVLAVHADEPSLIARSVTREGFLWVLPRERDQFAPPQFTGVPLQILAPAGKAVSFLPAATGHALTPAVRCSHLRFETADPDPIAATVRLLEVE
jgi:hypothetical protein